MIHKTRIAGAAFGVVPVSTCDDGLGWSGRSASYTCQSLNISSAGTILTNEKAPEGSARTLLCPGHS